MKARKILVSLAALALVAAISIGGTIAYLTSNDEVVNTFTVGNVAIKLDEADVNTSGDLLYKQADGTLGTTKTNEIADRVKANDYHLLPGHTYTKDPTVTVLAGSETSYIKMTVTFSKANELDAIFDPGATMTSIFNGYDAENWTYQGNTKDAAANTRTYEFWYKETVSTTKDSATVLDALFDSITVPGTITKEQLATIQGMTITVNAYAIQADGFNTPEAAWKEFK